MSTLLSLLCLQVGIVPKVVEKGIGISYRLVKRIGLDGVRFHDLRHTFASLMLLRGAKSKVISEALGHSRVAFTMDVYNHIIDGMQQDAMALLDEVLPPGKNGAKNKINANLTPTPRVMLRTVH